MKPEDRRVESSVALNSHFSSDYGGVEFDHENILINAFYVKLRNSRSVKFMISISWGKMSECGQKNKVKT